MGSMDKQLDEAFEMMRSWGVKGVKIDFMDRNGCQDGQLLRTRGPARLKSVICSSTSHGSYPNEGMRAKYRC